MQVKSKPTVHRTNNRKSVSGPRPAKPEGLSPLDKEWILQTIEKALEENFQAHEKACDQEIATRIEEQLANLETAEPARSPLVFTEVEKKKIAEMIRAAAEREATKDGKLNEFFYKAALPTEAEFDQFIYICSHHRLNPLLNQIYFQKRKGRALHIISIDSYRLKAGETGMYMPSRATSFFNARHEPYYGPQPDHCVTYCKRLGPDGNWHEIEQIAFFGEYKQTYSDGENLTPMWKKMGATMLEKCSEAKMLRKGWPEQFGGLYIAEELEQAERPAAPQTTAQQDLENARKGAPNMGHGQGDTVNRPKTGKTNGKAEAETGTKSSQSTAAGQQKNAAPQQEPTAADDPMNTPCVDCIPVHHIRGRHDGSEGMGPCMEDGCHCQGFNDRYPDPIVTGPHVTPGEDGKKDITRFQCTGRVIEFRDKDEKGLPLKTRSGSKFVVINIHGLPIDRFKDPHQLFQCYHASLHDCLAISKGEQITFDYSKHVDAGDKKAANKGLVWQSIELVSKIGLVNYTGGKPVHDEQAQTAPAAAENENQAAEADAMADQVLQQQQVEYVKLCKAHGLDPKEMHEGALRYELSGDGEVFDRATGEIFSRPR